MIQGGDSAYIYWPRGPNRVKLGQTFMLLSQSAQVQKISLKLSCGEYMGALEIPTSGTMEVSLWGDGFGTKLGTATPLDATLINKTTGVWFDFNFPTPISLTMNTTYALSVEAPTVGGGSVYMWLDSSNPYANGTGMEDRGSGWTTIPSLDFNFKIYGE